VQTHVPCEGTHAVTLLLYAQLIAYKFCIYTSKIVMVIPSDVICVYDQIYEKGLPRTSNLYQLSRFVPLDQ